jgi:hypothetical protein
MEGCYKYIENATVDVRQGVVLIVGKYAGNNIPSRVIP